MLILFSTKSSDSSVRKDNVPSYGNKCYFFTFLTLFTELEKDIGFSEEEIPREDEEDSITNEFIKYFKGKRTDDDRDILYNYVVGKYSKKLETDLGQIGEITLTFSVVVSTIIGELRTKKNHENLREKLENIFPECFKNAIQEYKNGSPIGEYYVELQMDIKDKEKSKNIIDYIDEYFENIQKDLYIDNSIIYRNQVRDILERSNFLFVFFNHSEYNIKGRMESMEIKDLFGNEYELLMFAVYFTSSFTKNQAGNHYYTILKTDGKMETKDYTKGENSGRTRTLSDKEYKKYLLENSIFLVYKKKNK